MATQEYMTSQVYSATIGGVVYNVTANVGGQMDYSTDKTFGGDVTVQGTLTAAAITELWYSVMTYGAVGNGSTNDTAAIQAAIDAAEAAGGGTVYFPANDYVVTELTVTEDNVALVGLSRAARLLGSTSDTTETVLITGDNCSVCGLTFVGRSTTAGTQNMAVKCSACARPVVENCFFTGSDATRGYQWHVYFNTCTDFRASGNIMEKVYGTTDNGYGVLAAACTGGIISENISTQTASEGRHHVYLSAGTSRVVVSSNKYFGGMSAMITAYATSAGTTMRDNTVTDNILVDGGDVTGVAGAIEVVGYADGCVIADNTITNYAAYGIKLEKYNAVASCKNMAVSGNKIYTPGKCGIRVQGSQYTSITDNLIYGANALVAASIDAISVITDTVDPDYCTITGNSVFGTTHEYAARVQGAGSVCSGNNFTAGSQGHYRGTAVAHIQGAGSPEGSVYAPIGSTYMRTDGSTSTTLYVKTAGDGTTNSTWTAK